ncbi:MAG: lipopolysaccharide biosynthesis protein [Bacteroidales bacterium]|nr:lipopolysaccharide biosynthesis protein [Bacteroidales bacterium]
MFLLKKISITENQKAIVWSFVEKSSSFAVNFVLQIVLARLLAPDAFAVLAMLAIFASVSQVFIDGGFATVLIQKQDCTYKDYNTVFIFNVLISLIVYVLFYFLAPVIEKYYEFSDLAKVTRIYFLWLVINAISMINRLLLIKTLQFRKLAQINTLATLFSSVPTIILAYYGYGYWALVCQNLVSTSFMTIGYLISYRWIPSLRFSFSSLKGLLPFGVRMFFVDLIYAIYNNIYSLLIGKYYKPSELGYYDRGKFLGSMGPIGFSDFFMRALYPIQSRIQHDEDLELSYNRAFRCCALFIVPISVFVSIFSVETISFLYGQKWVEAASFTAIMSLGFMLYPLHSLNITMLKVKASGSYLLRSEVCKKVIGICIALLLIRYKLYILILGWLFSACFDFVISEIYLYKRYSFSLSTSLKDLFSIFSVSLVIAACLKYTISFFIPNITLKFLLSGVIYCLFYFIVFRKRFYQVVFNR